jgi:YggT family protein
VSRKAALPPGRVADTKRPTLETQGRPVDALLNFAEYIVQAALTVIVWIVVAYAVMSWLIGFQVINLRNPFVARAAGFLDAVVAPLLRPFRRLLPAMAGLDFSPVILLIVVIGVQRYLVPPLFAWLHALVGGPVAV